MVGKGGERRRADLAHRALPPKYKFRVTEMRVEQVEICSLGFGDIPEKSPVKMSAAVKNKMLPQLSPVFAAPAPALSQKFWVDLHICAPPIPDSWR